MKSPTETHAARYAGIETWPTTEIVDAMVESQIAAVACLQAQRAPLTQAVDAAADRLSRGGRLIYLGAGTSGRVATLDAAELVPTFSWPAERAVSLIAGGPAAITQAIEGAEDDAVAAGTSMDELSLSPADVVIGIAASGNTPYVVGGLDHARKAGALTIGVTNNPQGRLRDHSDIVIAPDTGAEVLAGSTRMKAGTSQKAVLTCLSTGIFLRLGYVWRGRMVEMRPTNAKLHARAIEMVADLADCDAATAERVLNEAGHSIKLAVVMILRALPVDAARAALEAAGGRLHLVLAQTRTGDDPAD
ncbi:N-acetylmuramic acid 6-phosphate etherase [Paracoccus sp. (in: a-proteobacteria)]|uniref:N-acetylmuramic acid 6-phosphate etherase n=1 Tax=Paracoccus sp. TaxID=267 RepID=UPI003A83D0E4